MPIVPLAVFCCSWIEFFSNFRANLIFLRIRFKLLMSSYSRLLHMFLGSKQYRPHIVSKLFCSSFNWYHCHKLQVVVVPKLRMWEHQNELACARFLRALSITLQLCFVSLILIFQLKFDSNMTSAASSKTILETFFSRVQWSNVSNALFKSKNSQIERLGWFFKKLLAFFTKLVNASTVLHCCFTLKLNCI